MSQSTRLLAGLNPEQREAVLTTEGPVLVLAGAGSGKTRVIITRIAHLLGKRLAEPQQILAVTFTNKAAEEMRERVAGIVGKEVAKEIVLSTFHSFCVRVLRAEIEHVGYRRNFTISAENDTRTLLRRTLEDFDGARESFDMDTLLSHIGRVKNTGVTPEEAVPESEEETENTKKYRKWLPDVYERYQSALRAANTVDFDDLLLLTLRLWREHPRVLARYQEQFKYVMVDEYQDTNHVQYELLRTLVDRHHNLCVVGDDDQSIYSWRGADIGNILSFEKDFPEARVIKLEQNYRSTESILTAANSVIANNRARRAKNLWSELGAGRKIDWYVTGDEDLEAKELVNRLLQIREKTRAPYNHFAVLYRSNLQSRPIEIALRQENIPYVVVGGQEFFDRAEIKDILAYLKVISNPRDEASFLRVINVPRRGIGDTTLHHLHEICRTESLSLGKGLSKVLEKGGMPSNTEAGIRDFLSVVMEFRNRFKMCGGQLAEVVNDLIERIRYRTEIYKTCKSGPQFELRWGNVEALLTALRDYEAAVRKAGRGEPSLWGFLDESALATQEDKYSREERRREGVSLMTIHSAKGLEFPYVFIVGAEEGLLPHQKSVTEAALEEERRLFYVALTRAQRYAALFEAVARERHGRPRMTHTSRFVGEIPPDLLAQHIRAARDMVEAHVAPPKPTPRKIRAAGRGRGGKGR